MMLGLLIATLQIVSPTDGETVSLLRPIQSQYLEEPRSVRIKEWKNPAKRTSFVKTGFTQSPLCLEWSGAMASNAEVSVYRIGGAETNACPVAGAFKIYLTNLELDATYGVEVKSGEEAATTTFRTASQPPRALYAEGVSNFRDLGGWKTTDGHKVRQGLIFRSAGLRSSAHNMGSSLFNAKYVPGVVNIKSNGIETLRNELHICTDIDLRTPQETACMTASILGPDVRWVNESFAAYDFIDNLARGKEPFGVLFPVFAKAENYPILFHCAGGRDRTGTLSFLLLGLLGVAEDDLCRDWEFTVFCDDSMNFQPDRLKRLLTYLHSLPGATLQEQVLHYVHSCGVTDEEISAFKTQMLTK